MTVLFRRNGAPLFLLGLSLAWFLSGCSLNAANFSARAGHQAVVFNDRLWVIGGGGEDVSARKDVWSSANGENWVLETDAASFPPRADHQAVVFAGRLWVIGGFQGEAGPNILLNDAWSSDDGIHWKKATDDANQVRFSARYGHQVVVFDPGDGQEKLWLIGGSAVGADFTNELWQSSDGMTWNAVTVEGSATKLFSGRNWHQVIVFNGRIWVIGGQDCPGYKGYRNDIWWSDNGTQWHEVAQTGDRFPPSIGHNLAVLGDQLFWIGNGQVWVTDDGEHWVQQELTTASSEMLNRFRSQVVTLGDFIWVIGGYGENRYSNDVWRSKDGSDWEMVTASAEFSVRWYHRVAGGYDRVISVLNQRWLLGGEDFGCSAGQ